MYTFIFNIKLINNKKLYYVKKYFTINLCSAKY